MMCRTPIFALLAATMTFAAEGLNVIVNASVDSHIDSVTVSAGNQTMSLSKNGSVSWQGWVVGTAYSVTATGVATGYTAKWKVSTNNVVVLSGGMNDTITLSSTAFGGCALRFYGEPNTCTVTLDSQSGDGGTSSVTATYDAAMPSITVPTRTGYTFGGYYTSANGGGTQYYTATGASARNWDRTSATTLYAKWTVVTSTVTLDRQSGSGGSSSVTATYDAAMPSITVPTRTGYTFGGYYTSANGGGTQYYTATGASARNWDRTSATTLYAKWTVVTSTVTLDRQSGSGGSSSVTATYGQAMPSITVPTRTGYTFGGYYTSAGGGGTQYYTATGVSARTWDRTSATTLYAKWTVITSTVTLDRQSGSGGSSSVTATYGQTMPSATMPTRTGYTFGGYYTAANGGGTQYYTAAGASARNWDRTSATTLYAKWTAIQYTVTLNQQDGSGGTARVTATYGSAMPSATMPTRTAYTFGGYYTAANGGGTQYYKADGTSARLWNIASNTTLYAKWTAKKYAITVNPNGGVFQGSSNAFTYDLAKKWLETGTSNGFYVDKSSRTGYTPTGYWDAASGGNKVYYASGYAVDGTYWTGSGSAAKFKGISGSVTSLTVYAQWTVNTYTVTLNQQDGSGGTARVTATYDKAMPSATMPTRQGYTFGGYYTAANGGGTQYYKADGTSARLWNIASNTTLYAKWTAKKYAITVNPNGGVFQGSSNAFTYDLAKKWLETGTSNGFYVDKSSRTGYTPTGYWDAPSGGNKVYYASGYAVDGTYWTGSGSAAKFKGISGSVTLLTVYAQWTVNTYTVTLDMQDGSGGTARVTATYDKAMPSATMPTRQGYTFGGYYTAANGGGTQYYKADGTSARLWNIASNTTLYAKWTAKRYNLYINPNGGSYKDSTSATQVSPISGGTYLATGESSLWAIGSGSDGATRDGYDLTGYYDAANGGNKAYDRFGHAVNGTYWTGNGSAAKFKGIPGSATSFTVYAQWTANPYEVAFQPNGADGSAAMPNQSFTYDVTQNLNHVEFTYTGYAFRGWSTVSNRPTAFYPDGAEVVNLATGGVVNLYANWTGLVYTVSFDANGGVGAMTNMTCTYDVSTNLPACTFTRDGYGFKGWTTNVNDEVLFQDRARVTNLTTKAENVTLYACWTGVTYQVVLDARDPNPQGEGVITTNGQGKVVSVLTNSYVVGDAWNLPIPTNVDAHRSFAGWKYVDTNDVTITVAESDVVPPPSVFGGTTNLVAAWEWVVDDLATAVDAPDLPFETRGTVGEDGRYDDEPYSAMWFSQTNYVYHGASAVQSGALPQNGGNGQTIYISWLTTTVYTNGVLTFWWKCIAPNPVTNSWGDALGNSLHFGKLEGNTFTNLAELVGDSKGWVQVVYTNNEVGPVTLAWKFQLKDIDGEAAGGGTGWVDRVTWTPDGGTTVDVTPTHGVEYEWLRTNFPASASATDAELETLAESRSPGEGLPPGKTWSDGSPVMVWQDYWAGTNPNDPNDLFRARIAVSNNVPYISWQPDLSVTGDPQRVYKVLCAPTPSAQEWVEWPGPGDSGASTNRFFKVKLDWEGSQKN